MTKTQTTDTVELGDFVAGFFKLAGIELTGDEPAEGEPKEAPEPAAPVNPYNEAVRILKDLEEVAVDKGDTALALDIADRWVQLGDRGI